MYIGNGEMVEGEELRLTVANGMISWGWLGDLDLGEVLGGSLKCSLG